jgi:hypothetical protein
MDNHALADSLAQPINLVEEIRVQVKRLDLDKPGLLVIQVDGEIDDFQVRRVDELIRAEKITQPVLMLAPGMSIDIIPDEHMEALGWVRKPTTIS